MSRGEVQIPKFLRQLSYHSEPLPADTLKVIRDGLDPNTTGRRRSQVFWNVMMALNRLGLTVDGIVNLFERYPNGIARNYEGRLRQEVERIYNSLIKARKTKRKTMLSPS
jgi:hypothetical protein